MGASETEIKSATLRNIALGVKQLIFSEQHKILFSMIEKKVRRSKYCIEKEAKAQ